MRGLSPVVASGGHSSSRCAGLSPSWPLLLWSTGSRHAGSIGVAHGPSRSAACGIFPDQGSNPCPLHWQADSQPLCHQGSPHPILLFQSIHYHVPQNFSVKSIVSSDYYPLLDEESVTTFSDFSRIIKFVTEHILNTNLLTRNQWPVHANTNIKSVYTANK